MSQDKPDSNWGGARAGSGRQSLGKLPSKQLTYKIPGEIAEQLEALREGKESINAVARRLMYERLEQRQEEQASSAQDA